MHASQTAVDDAAATSTGRSWFFRYEGPTWIVALVIYGAWLGLVWFHAYIPWYVMIPLGGYLVAWQFSLQHETIHGFRSAPRWLRWLVALPPLGLWFPYPLYRRSHSIHHRNTHLTDPTRDTESFYLAQSDWRQTDRVTRWLLIVNQTFAGRLVLGPPFKLYRMTLREIRLVAGGDSWRGKIWLWHACGLALLFVFISGFAGMPWWHYVLFVAYPAMSLGLMRQFIEHRAGARPAERTAAVESNHLFGLLFLYNNLHIVHHLKPVMPWYEIPAFYRANRAKLLKHNGGFVLPGYGHLARRYLFRPVFIPIHPTL